MYRLTDRWNVLKKQKHDRILILHFEVTSGSLIKNKLLYFSFCCLRFENFEAQNLKTTEIADRTLKFQGHKMILKASFD